MGEIIQSLKEFVWDIIGYLIPGFTFVVLFNFIVAPITVVENNFLFKWELFLPYLIIVVAYILGFVVYSITIFKIKTQDKLIEFIKGNSFLNIKFEKFISKYISSKHSKAWIENFENSSTVISARKFLMEEKYCSVDKMKLNEIRNILMSRNPSMDEKTYTFMFRASVFDHLSTMLILILLGFGTQCFIKLFNINIYIIKSELPYKVFYVFSFFLIPLLGNSKRIFYSISQRIPFSNLK